MIPEKNERFQKSAIWSSRHVSGGFGYGRRMLKVLGPSRCHGRVIVANLVHGGQPVYKRVIKKSSLTNGYQFVAVGLVNARKIISKK